MFNFHSQYFAAGGDCTSIGVEFTNAPELAPEGIVLELYATLKYVIQEAATLGIDPTKISTYGVSGGGFLSLGLSYLLV